MDSTGSWSATQGKGPGERGGDQATRAPTKVRNATKSDTVFPWWSGPPGGCVYVDEGVPGRSECGVLIRGSVSIPWGLHVA